MFTFVLMAAIAKFIQTFLDYFYPLVKRLMNKQTYYYIACGGGNTLFGFVLYYLAYHYWFQKENFDLGFIVIKPHIASFIVSFGITFPIGFFLSRYIVWSESDLRGRQQLVRHFLSLILFVFMNYILLKLFVEVFEWWAMPSQILTTTIIVIVSYLSQKYYSFKN
jgi:putative flippase GtrA